MDETIYSLTELAEEADVSTRTVRYYISEGLLPPPEGGGHASRYSAAHLTRLRQIAALKAQYLPLREIRNRLGNPDLPAPGEPGTSRSSARDYLSTLRRAPGSPRRRQVEDALMPAADRMSSPPSTDAPSGVPMGAPMGIPDGALADADDWVDEAAGLAPPEVWAMERSPPATVWRRIAIGDGAELIITDDLYRRRRDKVDWLVRWAHKVLDR